MTVDTDVNSTTLTLAADVRSWQPGDTLVVASTDYSMYQAEEFRVLHCRACAPNQVRVAGRMRAQTRTLQVTTEPGTPTPLHQSHASWGPLFGLRWMLRDSKGRSQVGAKCPM